MTWLREIAGWLLVGLGLFIFYICFLVLMSEGPLFGEAVYLTIIGFIVFRGGIQLLRLGLATRISLRARQSTHGATTKSQPSGWGRGSNQEVPRR